MPLVHLEEVAVRHPEEGRICIVSHCDETTIIIWLENMDMFYLVGFRNTYTKDTLIDHESTLMNVVMRNII